MSLSKQPGPELFGPPKAGKATDSGKLLKIAERVIDTLKQNAVYPEPIQIDPRHILVSWLNRQGAPPNVQHLHFIIIRSFVAKVYDPTRPQHGIRVEIKSEEGKRRLIEHNRRFTAGCSLLPPISENDLLKQRVIYASLAFSHVNLVLRIGLAGLPSPAGDLAKAIEDDPNLKEVVFNGHHW